MNNFIDLSSHGYQIVRELGHNRSGGRITYLATNLKTQQPAVIKQFQFAQVNTSWSDYDAYEREIQVLRGLNHPGIPRYLDSFQTKDGFCMVQEYKNAPSLTIPRSFDPDEIKKIAVGVLEILVYLQNRLPVVIHRDVKPENILVDDEINVFLVDFGLARIGEGEVAMSSVAKGTLGFMPPEQLFNRHLSEASDLYGLGTTLICLLTGTKSTEISQLIDEDYRLNFKHLVPKLSLRWIDWLQEMVELKPKDRYPNALAALAAIQPIYVIRIPEVELSQLSWELTAKKLGEKLTHTITINNSVPETLLEGNWQVVSHLSDPPHQPDKHLWIAFDNYKFVGNQCRCRITIDTRYLMADTIYQREILLHSNALPATQAIALKVKTAPIPIETKKLPLSSLGLLIFIATIAAWAEAFGWNTIISEVGNIGIAIALFVVSIAGAFGLIAAMTAGAMATWTNHIISKWKIKLPALDTGVMLLIAGIAAYYIVQFGSQFRAMEAAIALGFASVDAIAFMVTFDAEGVANNCLKRGFSPILAVGLSVLATALGISLGIGLEVGMLNRWVIGAILVTSLPLSAIVLYPPLERARLIANYRKSEQFLIKS